MGCTEAMRTMMKECPLEAYSETAAVEAKVLLNLAEDEPSKVENEN